MFTLPFLFPLFIILTSVLVNFRLFDVKGKGAIDRFDLARMLQSMYGTFRHDERFTILVSSRHKPLTIPHPPLPYPSPSHVLFSNPLIQLRNFVNNIFDFPMISHSGTITIDTFQYVGMFDLPSFRPHPHAPFSEFSILPFNIY